MKDLNPTALRRMRHQVRRVISQLQTAERDLLVAEIKASQPPPVGKKRGRKPAAAPTDPRYVPGLPEDMEHPLNNLEPRVQGASWEPAP